MTSHSPSHICLGSFPVVSNKIWENRNVHKHTNTTKPKPNPFGILFENMCALPHGLTWVRSSHGQQVNGAVIGGSEHGGMYVGRVNHSSGDLLLGKVHCKIAP